MECTDGDSFVLTRHLLVVRGNRHHTPCAAELGSNLRTVLRTKDDSHKKMALSELPRTIDVTDYAP